MDKCFICMDDLDGTIYLPKYCEYLGENINIYKNTYIVKDSNNYKFVYLLICDNCIHNYLKKNKIIHKYLINREIGVK